LLADDNVDMRDYVRRLLERSYEVVAVADGQQALEAIREQLPDLVLTDVMMPVLDGFGLVAAIRGDERMRSLPVVMLSARAGEEARVDGLAAGADDYLIKPFAFAELLARIRALVRRGRVAETPRLSVGDLEMDLVTRKVMRNAQLVELTVREFELLEYLLRYHGQVVSRETLARDVWKETARTTPLDNVIDVHIARLRRKVDLEQPIKLIHTVRGVGFMLREGEP
jgi:DNA-binding response OmpR family regulator